MTTITLYEHQPHYLDNDALPFDIGELLWEHYSPYLTVDFPTPKTNNRWRLTSNGYVGYIPLTHDIHLALYPKVGLTNLFGMLGYAYNINFKTLPGLIACESLADLYERLAYILAQRIVGRLRRGLHRDYVTETARLPYLRGRLDVNQMMRHPDAEMLVCSYDTLTADIDDNRILAWTLHQILRSGICTETSLPTLRQAYRTLSQHVTLTPYQAVDYHNRHYHRLNHDYAGMHALCNFFLSNSGPGHQTGKQPMVPFLVNMNLLYEKFVAAWLTQHLPSRYQLKAQERVDISARNQLNFIIDLIIFDTFEERVRYVLDTKYKITNKPAPNDIQQMIAYAHIKQCDAAILVYPSPAPFEAQINNIQVQSLTFALDDDLDAAGHAFMERLAL